MVNKHLPQKKRRVQRVLRGYTMVELVTVMVITGILAAVAAPKIFNNDAFKVRGFYDQVLATLRYAQQTAVAQHRNVCVDIAAADITLKIANEVGSTSSCGTDLAAPGPRDSILGYAQPDCTSSSTTYKICTPPLPYTVSPPISISPVATLGFDAFGKSFTLPGVYISAQSAVAISDTNCRTSLGAVDSSCLSATIYKYIYVEAETGYVH